MCMAYLLILVLACAFHRLRGTQLVVKSSDAEPTH